MSAVIRLDHVIRETLDRPYRDLVTRPTGRAVRQRVMDQLHAVPAADALLDFSEIGVIDYSCADEVVAKLLFETPTLPVARVVLCGVREAHVEAIEEVLRHHGLVVVAVFAGGALTILGDASDDHRDAVRALAQVGRAGAEPVARVLAWDVPRAQEALQHLAWRRCVLAHPDATYELGQVA